MTSLHHDFHPTLMFIRGAHAGQFTKGGDPYWTHPLAVANIVRDLETKFGPLPRYDGCARCDDDEYDNQIHAALLHDVVEDTPITLENLREYGFNAKVVEIVRLLTHVKEDHPNLTYLQYIEQVIIGSGNLGAMRIKLADNTHNRDPARIAMLPPEMRTIKKRYDKSAAMLGQALKEARQR